MLHGITAIALDRARQRYHDDEIELCEIPQVAHAIIENRVKDSRHTLNTYCYWLEDGVDNLEDIVESMLLYCTTHKVIAYAVCQDDIDEGILFISLIQENKGDDDDKRN